MRSLPRIFVFIFLTSLSLASCIAQQGITKIEYNSGTRTYREQVIITPDSLVSVKENFRTDSGPVVSKRSLSDPEWKKLLQALGSTRPEDLPALESPSDKRTYDAAAHTSIRITTADSKSFSHGFDDTKPNEKLKPLMNGILSLK
jgi:hypothetical protein